MHLQTQNVFDLARQKRNSSHGLREDVKQGGRANGHKTGFLWVIFSLQRVIKVPLRLHIFHLNKFPRSLIYAQRRGEATDHRACGRQVNLMKPLITLMQA